MTKYKVVLTDDARLDITDILSYIAFTLRASIASKNLRKKFADSMKSLETMPQRISPLQEEPWRKEDIRALIANNYYIYFKIDEAEKKVYILCVSYSGRDRQNVLNDILNLNN